MRGSWQAPYIRAAGERPPRARPQRRGSPGPIPNPAVKPAFAESTAAQGCGRAGRRARGGRFSIAPRRPAGGSPLRAFTRFEGCRGPARRGRAPLSVAGGPPRPVGRRLAYPRYAPRRAARERAARRGRGPARGPMGLSASSGEVFALRESLCAPLREGRRRARSEVTRACSFALSGRVHRIRPAALRAVKRPCCIYN